MSYVITIYTSSHYQTKKKEEPYTDSFWSRFDARTNGVYLYNALTGSEGYCDDVLQETTKKHVYFELFAKYKGAFIAKIKFEKYRMEWENDEDIPILHKGNLLALSLMPLEPYATADYGNGKVLDFRFYINFLFKFCDRSEILKIQTNGEVLKNLNVTLKK